MGENTDIAWAHDTHNPWEGCTKISPACDNCYAEARNQRFYQGAHWGPHADRRRMSRATLNKPHKWNKEAGIQGERRRVFCASLADVFDNHKSILPAWREDLWALIRETPHLDWLLLTKRPQNIKKFLPEDWGQGYPNVWLGITGENDDELHRRSDHLFLIPAAKYFLSAEPLLGPLDIIDRLRPAPHLGHSLQVRDGYWRVGLTEDGPRVNWRGFDWVIAGGESGPNFRPGNLDWFKSLRDQCLVAGVPFFFKQHEGKTRREIDAKGRELDGVVWNQFPEVSHD